MGGRGSSSASNKATEMQVPIGWQVALSKGQTVGLMLPSSSAQYGPSLDAVAKYYRRAPELDQYAQGSYANGTPHVSTSDNGSNIVINVGSATSWVSKSSLAGLNKRQRDMAIELAISTVYWNAKQRGLL